MNYFKEKSQEISQVFEDDVTNGRDLARELRKELELEYKNNYDHLADLIGKPIRVMSHPCGDYNETTLEILNSMKYHGGFMFAMGCIIDSAIALIFFLPE